MRLEVLPSLNVYLSASCDIFGNTKIVQSPGYVSIVADILWQVAGPQRGIFEVELEQFVPLALVMAFGATRADSTGCDARCWARL